MLKSIIITMKYVIYFNIGDREMDEVLSSLYIIRSDVSMNVRQSALTTWKAIVSNSPRTLLQIMPVLVKQLIEKLALPSDMLRAVAGSSLGINSLITTIYFISVTSYLIIPSISLYLITVTICINPIITTIITITQITIIIITIFIIISITLYLIIII